MIKTEETIKGFGGVDIFTQRLMSDDAKANVIIVHGYCEHSMRYLHFAKHFNEAGFNVFMLDQRGHGRSGGRRAAVMQWEEYFDDLDRFVARVKEWEATLPLFIIGHSMGGLTVFAYIVNRPNAPFKGAVLSSPFFGLAIDVSPVKRLAAGILTKVLPNLSLKSDLDPYFLTHDINIVKDYIKDPLVDKVANTRWFTEAERIQRSCMERSSEVTMPFLLMHGEEDHIAGPEYTRRIYQRLGSSDKKLIMWEGMYHEIFNELDRVKVYEKAVEWLKGRI